MDIIGFIKQGCTKNTGAANKGCRHGCVRFITVLGVILGTEIASPSATYRPFA